MKHTGFGYKWHNWVLESISLARFSFLVNGPTTKEFDLRRGLHQGDPLSLFLFLLVAKVLHLMLSKVEDLGLIFISHLINLEVSLSYLYFTNDTILFLEVKKE